MTRPPSSSPSDVCGRCGDTRSNHAHHFEDECQAFRVGGKAPASTPPLASTWHDLCGSLASHVAAIDTSSVAVMEYLEETLPRYCALKSSLGDDNAPPLAERVDDLTDIELAAEAATDDLTGLGELLADALDSSARTMEGAKLRREVDAAVFALVTELRGLRAELAQWNLVKDEPVVIGRLAVIQAAEDRIPSAEEGEETVKRLGIDVPQWAEATRAKLRGLRARNAELERHVAWRATMDDRRERESK